MSSSGLPINLSEHFNKDEQRVWGLGSGLSNETVKQQAENKAAPREKQKEKINDQIENNSKKIEAYQTLQNKFNDFQKSLDNLRNGFSRSESHNDAFKTPVASMTVSDGSDNNYMGVNITNEAPRGVYDITVDQLATREYRRSSEINAPDKDTDIVGGGQPLNAGTFNISMNDGTNIDVTIEDGDSLNKIVNKINNANNNNNAENVRASILRIEDGKYKINLQASKTGVNNGYTLNENGTAFNFSQINAAQDSKMSVDGEQITRSSNSISDAIDGITFQLDKETGGRNLRLEVARNNQAVKDAIQDFVKKYNEIATYITQQNRKTTDAEGNQKLAEDSYLGNEDNVDFMFNKLRDELNSSIANSLGSVNTLSEIGITMEEETIGEGDEQVKVRNYLSVKEDKLDDAVFGKFDQVRDLFQSRLDSTNSEFYLSQTSNKLQIFDFDIDIDEGRSEDKVVRLDYVDSGGNAKSSYADYKKYSDGTMSIIGRDNTAFQGMRFIYTGGQTQDSTTINLSPGLANRLWDYSYEVTSNNGVKLDNTEKVGGEIDDLIHQIREENKDSRKQIDDLKDKIEHIKKTTYNHYQEMETKLFKANQALMTIDAYLENMKNNG
jgi:flagellar hook-associated protein 2